MIDIERLKREYRAACNKSCINPDEGPGTEYEVARARAELAKLRKRQTCYKYTNWLILRGVVAFWIDALARMSPGGYCYVEVAIWSAFVGQVRRRYPLSLDDIDEGDFMGLVREVMTEERVRRDRLPLRDLHARQRQRGLEVYAPRFVTL